MITKLEILKFFIVNKDKSFTAKELSKIFNLTQPAIWKNIRELWASEWIVQVDNTFPMEYKFNELFLAIITKT